MKKLLAWFEALQHREKIMVSIAAIFVLLTLFYLLLFEPTQKRLAGARTAYFAADELHSFMQLTRQKVTQLKTQPQNTSIQIIKDENLLAYLDSSMQRYGIGTQLNSITPGREQGANLRFDKVAYDALMNWLSHLYFKNGINVVGLSVSSTADDGFVKASLALE